MEQNHQSPGPGNRHQTRAYSISSGSQEYEQHYPLGFMQQQQQTYNAHFHTNHHNHNNHAPTHHLHQIDNPTTSSQMKESELKMQHLYLYGQNAHQQTSSLSSNNRMQHHQLSGSPYSQHSHSSIGEIGARGPKAGSPSPNPSQTNSLILTNSHNSNDNEHSRMEAASLHQRDDLMLENAKYLPEQQYQLENQLMRRQAQARNPMHASLEALNSAALYADSGSRRNQFHQAFLHPHHQQLQYQPQLVNHHQFQMQQHPLSNPNIRNFQPQPHPNQPQHQMQLQQNPYAPSYILTGPPVNTQVNQNGDQDLAAAAMGPSPGPNPARFQEQPATNNQALTSHQDHGANKISATGESHSAQLQQLKLGPTNSQSLLNSGRSLTSHGGLPSPMRRIAATTSNLLTNSSNVNQPSSHATSNSLHHNLMSSPIRAGYSSLSLASSSLLIEERLQNEMKKLQSELRCEKEKNDALNSQLNINSSLMAAFEQSLTTLNTRLRQLSVLNETKDKQLEELREELNKYQPQPADMDSHPGSQRTNTNGDLTTGEDRDHNSISGGSNDNVKTLIKSPTNSPMLDNHVEPSSHANGHRTGQSCREEKTFDPDDSAINSTNHDHERDGSRAREDKRGVTSQLKQEIQELKRQLVEKDRLLMDMRLEALTTAHQMEQLESKISRDQSLVSNHRAGDESDEGVMVGANYSPSGSDVTTITKSPHFNGGEPQHNGHHNHSISMTYPHVSTTNELCNHQHNSAPFSARQGYNIYNDNNNPFMSLITNGNSINEDNNSKSNARDACESLGGLLLTNKTAANNGCSNSMTNNSTSTSNTSNHETTTSATPSPQMRTSSGDNHSSHSSTNGDTNATTNINNHSSSPSSSQFHDAFSHGSEGLTSDLRSGQHSSSASYVGSPSAPSDVPIARDHYNDMSFLDSLQALTTSN